MLLYSYLIENYEAGEPIFTVDIDINGVSDDNIRRQFKTLTDQGKIRRFENGVYYIPKKTRLKGGGALSSEKVAYNKYICRHGEYIGYYSGYTFANQLGVSTQVPYKREIVTNNISAVVKEVEVGSQKYLVRKARVPVTNDNYKVLRFLDLLKGIDEYADEERAIVRSRLMNYVKDCHITREQIDKYIVCFPIIIYKNMYEMRLEHVFA